MASNEVGPDGLRGATLVMAGVFTCAVVSLVWLLNLPSAAERLTTPVAPVVVPVTDGPQSIKTNIQFVVEVSPAISALAPSWQGIITAVHIATGDVVNEGTAIVEIDGSLRIAAATPRPFHRPLSVGDQGSDVDQLAAFLIARGHLDSGWKRGLSYNTALGLGVRALAAELNVAITQGIGPIEFDPGWLVWIPSEGLVADTVYLTAGALAPALGQPVVAFRPTVTAARLSSVAGPPLTVAVAEEVIVGSITLAIEGGSLIVDDAARQRLAQLVSATADIEGSNTADRPTEPIELSLEAIRHTTFDAATRAVPVAAVMTDAGGLQCVVVPASDGGYVGKPVTVVGSETGRSTAFVRGLSDSTEVVANPVAARVSSVCAGR